MRPYYEHAGITIYHGDCRDVLPNVWFGVDLLLTDPPYGDDHDTDYRRFSGGLKRADGTDKPRYVYKPIEDDTGPFDPAMLLRVGSQQIIFGANRFSDRLPCGSWLIWDKRTPTGSKGVMSDAEPAWWSRGHGVYIWSHTWDGFNRASERGLNCHPTQKPVALMTWCLSFVPEARLILDPFMGSGPVMVAAKASGRHAIGIEVEERYCEIAAKRLSQEVLPLDVSA